MMADANYYENPAAALEHAMVKTNQELHAARLDDSLSGTTAVGVLVKVSGAPNPARSTLHVQPLHCRMAGSIAALQPRKAPY